MSFAAISAGGSGTDAAHSISIKNNSIVMAGIFSTTCHFGLDSVISNGGWDVFIAKYDLNGNLQWVKSAGGNGDDEAIARIGTDNNIYLAGDFLNVLALDTFHLYTAGSLDIFVASCDSNGNFLWARQAGSNNVDLTYGMAIDSSNNMYFTGYYGGNATFGNITVNGFFDIYAVKYNSLGTAQWVKSATGIGGQQSRHGWGVSVSNNEVLVTGDFQNNLNFDNSPFSFNAMGLQDIYVARIDQLFTGIEEHDHFSYELNIQPNPTNLNCTITAFDFYAGDLFLYDISGRILLQQNLNTKSEINLSNFSGGIYLVEIKDKEGRSVKGKLFKE